MALPGNIDDILKNSPSSLDIDSIKDSIDDLDIVIGKLNEISQFSNGLDDTQKNLLKTLKKYRKELEDISNGISDVNNGFTRWAKGARQLATDMQSLAGAIKAPLDGMESLGKFWGRVDQAANDFGKTIGLNTKAVAQLRDESIKFANDVHIGEKYNTSIKEMIELQQKYVSSVGRNLQISNKQRETLLATSKLMRDNTNEFAKSLENMGIGLEKSGDIAAKMFNEASKSGISFEKYSQSVTQNLTKVQSYGFKNGVEGLTAMAKRAAEVNLNIGEAFKVADKIQTGGIESAIKMGANLQVLGGSFARMGDPMGMLYQGLNDVEGLQDRMIEMFSHLGKFEDGQVKISAANRLRVNAAAEAMGISKDEMFNMINRQAVRNRVENQMRGISAFQNDAELKELVTNTATLNKEGTAVVNINGQEKKLNEVTSNDKEYLKNLQKSESEDIKDIAQILRGYTDVQEGFTKEIENKKAQAFSNIGKATKMIYDKLGQSDIVLNIIKDAVLAITIAQTGAALVGGLGRAFGSIANSVKGAFGKGSVAATTASRTATQQTILSSAGTGTGTGTPSTPSASSGNMATAPSTGTHTVGTTPTNTSIVKGAGFFARNGAKMLGGAAMGGVMAGIGYLADGSWKGDRSQKNKAIGGTAGAVIGGALGAIGGPLGAMIGQEAGKLLGEVVAKQFDKGRAKKKKEYTEELKNVKGKNGENVGEAFAQLSDNYSRGQLKNIKKALEDGQITEDEIKRGLMRKIAKSGDKELIEKFGSKEVKAKINEEIEKLNAKVENGNFDMQTGEFKITGQANIGMMEPVAMANGGKLSGPSDINGPGMPILGSNIVVGGGEYVVNPKATKEYEPLLDIINFGTTNKMASGTTNKMASGGVIPAIKSIAPSITKNPMVPLSVKAISGLANDMKSSIGPDKLEVAPVKLDINGTIKLDAGGQQVDLTSIVNNPAFLTQLSQMIERRLADNINGGNFKELRKNKQHAF